MGHLLSSTEVRHGRRKRAARYYFTVLAFSVIAALLPSLAAPTQAGSHAFLVKDIEPGAAGSYPYFLATANGSVFFNAGDITNNHRYLWKSNGAAGATAVVAEIMPTTMLAIDRTLFFTASDGTHGMELWKSDGTAAGTSLIKDIAVGEPASYPTAFARMGSTLMFIADDRKHGYELWRSDGTAAGTLLVKDIRAGPAAASPSSLTSVNGALFFSADDGASGEELWKSDGTQRGTTLVSDIFPGIASSNPAALANGGGTLMFFANDGVHGTELWSSGGTPASTALVKDIWPGISSSFERRFASYAPVLPVAGKLFFTANDGTHGTELWSSNGRSASTLLVKDIFPGASSSYPAALTDRNGNLAFIANDSIHGYELWRSDGTAEGTALVQDIYSGPGTPFGLVHVDPDNIWLSNGRLTSSRGMLFFAASDGLHGNEPWQSNGTTATQLVADIAPGSISSLDIATPFVQAGDLLFFSANDRYSGQELWALHVDDVIKTYHVWSPWIQR